MKPQRREGVSHGGGVHAKVVKDIDRNKVVVDGFGFLHRMKLSNNCELEES